MKSFFPIPDNAENRITYGFLLLFAAALPFDRFYSQLVFCGLIANTLIHLRKERLGLLWRKEVLIAASVYLLTVTGTLYSAHRGVALGYWEKQMAILFFPLLLAISPLDIKRYTPHLLTCFALVVTAVIASLYVDAARIIRFYRLPVASLFSPTFLSHHFSAPMGLHATYLSLFCALSLFRMLQVLLRSRNTGLQTAAAIISVTVLSAGLLQLGSRAVVIACLPVLLILFPATVDPSKRWWVRGATLLVVLAAWVAISQADGLRYRILTGFEKDLSLENNHYSIADSRAKRWQVAFDLIRKKPVAGYGTGEEVSLLADGFYKRGLYDAYLNRLNAHNQYLSFLLRGGLLALAVYAMTLFYFLRLSWRQRNVCLTGFLVLITVTGFSENLLDVNKGIFFYSFFLSVFAAGSWKHGSAARHLKWTGSNPAMKKNVFTTNEPIA